MAFNLKKYAKGEYDPNRPNSTTERQLVQRNKKEKEKESDTITEEQLETSRVPEKEQTLEALLDKNRTGAAEAITEGMLDKKKGDFDIKFRNKDTYDGDINKLEEKRLANDPVEDEKYEVLSETKKGLRWWEKTDSPDGLILANKKKA